jgi:hypothetical protein
MPRANVILENKFAHKKSIFEYYMHMIKILITLINSDDRSNDQSDESQTLNEVTQRVDWSEWKEIMRIEFNSLVENQIWDLIKRFDIKQNVIIDRWTFRLKRDRDDKSQRYKVRWIAHDFKQRHEVDFDETFVLIVKSVSYKSLMTINIIRELQICYMNVVIAFLYELLRSQDDVSCLLEKW